MLQWLNRNGAAIQALASVASVATTLALVWISARYVSLTQELARAARQQLRIQQQSVASETARLITLAEVFLTTLRYFPDNEQDAARLRDVALWKRSDVTTLATLAASVVGAETPVRQTIHSLNWLRDKAEQLQQQPEGLSDAQSSSQWPHELDLARKSLRAVREAAEAAQRALAAESEEASDRS